MTGVQTCALPICNTRQTAGDVAARLADGARNLDQDVAGLDAGVVLHALSSLRRCPVVFRWFSPLQVVLESLGYYCKHPWSGTKRGQQAM